jgi:hypothetical protein
MLSPENALENIRPRPPPWVCISMLGLIQHMDPRSVIIFSPLSRLQMTTGKLPPLISYLIAVPPYSLIFGDLSYLF